MKRNFVFFFAIGMTVLLTGFRLVESSYNAYVTRVMITGLKLQGEDLLTFEVRFGQEVSEVVSAFTVLVCQGIIIYWFKRRNGISRPNSTDGQYRG